MRSIANRNEALGLPPVVDPGAVYVSKDDARDAQSMESKIYGGQIPNGGMAAQMQVSNDACISCASRLNGIVECCGQNRTRETSCFLLAFGVRVDVDKVGGLYNIWEVYMTQYLMYNTCNFCHRNRQLLLYSRTL